MFHCPFLLYFLLIIWLVYLTFVIIRLLLFRLIFTELWLLLVFTFGIIFHINFSIFMNLWVIFIIFFLWNVPKWGLAFGRRSLFFQFNPFLLLTILFALGTFQFMIMRIFLSLSLKRHRVWIQHILIIVTSLPLITSVHQTWCLFIILND